MSTTREQVGEAVGRALARLDERRAAFGLVGLPELDAEIRMRALDRLTVEQFQHLLSLEPEPRAGMIAALVAGQRRAHELAGLRPVAVSTLDGRYLYRWWCACGGSAGDFFSAEEGRADWRRHAGILEGPPPRSAGRPPGAPRARRALESTE